MNPARRWRQRTMAVLLGVSSIFVLEVGLRVSGTVADPLPPALPEGWDSQPTFARSDAQNLVVQVDATDDWQVSPEVAGRQMRAERWTTNPATDRVFVFGGSTTLGVPFEHRRGVSFPEQLRQLATDQGKPLEVINLGGTGFSTTEVVELAQQVVKHPARAWVVYAANNEFFRLSLDIWDERTDALRAQRNLQRLHLFRWLEDRISLGPSPLLQVELAAREQRSAVAAVIADALARPEHRPVESANGQWVRTDPAHSAVIDRLQHNIHTLSQLAREADVTLMVVDVRPNLLQPPWLSLHDPSVPGRTRDHIRALLTRAQDDIDAAQLEAAEATAREAVQADPTHAQSWYLLGVAQHLRGERDAATHSLTNALNLDMDPGRPPETLRRALRDAVQRTHTHLITLEGWEARGLAGSDWFHDSCHLSPDGYAFVGEAVWQALTSALDRSSASDSGVADRSAPAPDL